MQAIKEENPENLEDMDTAPPEEQSEQVEKYLEKLQRVQADFENYRKRTTKERQEIADRAKMQILRDFLELCDTLKTACEKPDEEEHEQLTAYREGVCLILKQFEDFLTRENVEPIEAQGEMFDPHLHEAMTTVPAEEEEQVDTVAQEFRKGYKFKDKVLRHSRVAVYK